MQVGLVEGAKSLDLSAGSPFRVGDRSLPGGIWHVEPHQGGVVLMGEDGERAALAGSEFRLTLDDAAATW
ncbi:hypothetical protein ACXWPL_09295, partial [Streptococcus pyogenes]